MPASKRAFPKRHRPGSKWRVLFHGWHGAKRSSSPAHHIASDDYPPSEFDELVIDGWFHLEQMSARSWWIGITSEDGTGVSIDVTVGEHGMARSITIEEDS